MDCKIQGCLRPAYRREMCSPHYEKFRKENGPRCDVPDCGRNVHAQGLCNRHYRRHAASLKEECSVVGCGRPAQAKGFCNSHYRRQLKHGHLDPTRATDWGGRSAHPLYESWQSLRRNVASRPVSDGWLNDFWAFVADVGDKPPRHTLRRLNHDEPWGPSNFEWRAPVGSPIEAASKAEYMRKWQRHYRDTQPEKYRAYEFKRRHGLSYEAHAKMLAEQDGKCAICGKEETAVSPRSGAPRGLAVDHCHDSNYVRGLLCTGCNTGLGSFGESTETLQKAIRYLKTHPPRLV